MGIFRGLVDIIEFKAGRGDTARGRLILLSALLIISLIVLGYTFLVLVPSINGAIDSLL